MLTDVVRLKSALCNIIQDVRENVVFSVRSRPFLRYNQLRNNRAIAPENRRGMSRETSWTKDMEEARYLEVARKVRGTLERDRSNTTCSALKTHSIRKRNRAGDCNHSHASRPMKTASHSSILQENDNTSPAHGMMGLCSDPIPMAHRCANNLGLC